MRCASVTLVDVLTYGFPGWAGIVPFADNLGLISTAVVAATTKI